MIPSPRRNPAKACVGFRFTQPNLRFSGHLMQHATERVLTTMAQENPKSILVAGATGYVGGRLVPKLLEQGYRVRAMARSRAKLANRPWASHPRLEVVEGDVQDLGDLMKATAGCWASASALVSFVTGITWNGIW